MNPTPELPAPTDKDMLIHFPTTCLGCGRGYEARTKHEALYACGTRIKNVKDKIQVVRSQLCMKGREYGRE